MEKHAHFHSRGSGLRLELRLNVITGWTRRGPISDKQAVPGACFGVGMFPSSGCSCSRSLLYTDLVVELKWRGEGKVAREGGRRL